MTRITKPVARESATIERGRPLIVTLHPRHLEIRAKGLRQSFTVDYSACLWLAVKRDFEAQRRVERKGKRK